MPKQKKQLKKKAVHLCNTLLVAVVLFLFFAGIRVQKARASETNGQIFSGPGIGFAWSETIGWVNFGDAEGRVAVSDFSLSGNAASIGYGWINMAPVNGGVANNGEGALSGYAWGEKLDWINFSGVTIDQTGTFHGSARGSLVGNLMFDCAGCNVSTDWRHASNRSTAPTGSILSGSSTASAVPPNDPFQEQAPIFDVGGEVIDASTGNLVTRVAPGELLPISVKLVNFGGGQKIDVVITYNIMDAGGNILLTSSETVAVETTASFIKVIQIPNNFTPGTYTAQSSVTHLAQKFPATASYQFNVERKFAGIFLSSLGLYAAGAALIGIISATIAAFAIRKRRRARFIAHEYLNVPASSRMYYELIGDTIMQLRYQIGSKVLDITRSIDALVMDEKSGVILELNDNPAKIMATILTEYEKVSGNNVSVEYKKYDNKSKGGVSTASKHLLALRKSR